MHEFSICENLVDLILGEYQKQQPQPRRLIAAHVVIGKLRQIVPEYLASAYEILTADNDLKGSELKIKILDLEGNCPRCDFFGKIELPYLNCPKCQSQIELKHGMELYLENLEIEVQDEKRN